MMVVPTKDYVVWTTHPNLLTVVHPLLSLEASIGIAVDGELRDDALTS